MTISSTTVVTRTDTNGSTHTFNFGHPFGDPDDLTVYLVTTADWSIDLQVRDTDYTVSSNGDEDENGGSITFINELQVPTAPVTGKVCVILREPELVQDFNPNGRYPAEQGEDALDRIYQLLQILEWRSDRSIRLNDAYADNDLILPNVTTRANKALVFDADGDLTVGVTGADVLEGAETAQAAAEDAAGSAAVHASTAEIHKIAAQTARTGAETAETNAETAETNAEAAQAAAVAAQAAAEIAQAAAELAETHAETAETNAETAETNAETAASSATSSASSASTSATNAATSATNASNSASAAATSASNAATSAANALTSENNAAASAARLNGTSTTSNSLATGSKSFTTQAGKFFDAGTWLLVTSDADPDVDYMHGVVTSYVGTALTVEVTNFGGSGTHTDWTIRVAGTRGATGAAGSLDFTILSSDTPVLDDTLVFGDVSDSENPNKATITSVLALLTASEILTRLLTVDGSGSGLDADLLDGQSSAFYATASSVSDHIGDATAAHAASAIAYNGGTGMSATDVEAAIDELATEKQDAATAITQGKHTIWVPASAMIPRTTAGAASATTESTTNRVMNRSLDFDQTTQEFAQFTVAPPKSWDEGSVAFQPIWTAASGTGTVAWRLAGLARSNDDPIDTAFGTAQSSSDTLIATSDVHIGPESSAITIGGTPAENDLLYFQVDRDVANDTLTADAKLLGVRLFLTINAGNDA